MMPLLLGMGAKMVTAMSVIFGTLALISSKALIVGKLALAVSVVLFIQYLFSTGRVSSFNYFVVFKFFLNCISFTRGLLVYHMVLMEDMAATEVMVESAQLMVLEL